MSHPLIRARNRNRRINFGQIQQEFVFTRPPEKRYILNREDKIDVPRGFTEHLIVRSTETHEGLAYHRVAGKPVVIRGFENRDFFVHHPLAHWRLKQEVIPEFWAVSEASTGLKVTIGVIARKTQKAAIQEAQKRLDNVGKPLFDKTIATAPKITDFTLGQIQPELLFTRVPKATDPIAPELDSLAVFARLFHPQEYVTEPIVNGIREAYRQIHPHIDLPVAIKGKHPKPLEDILAFHYGYGSGDPDRSIQAFWYHAHGYAPNGGPLPEIHRYPSLEGGDGYMMLAICPDAPTGRGKAMMADLGKCYPLYRVKATKGLSELSGEVLHCGAWAMNEETGLPYCVAFGPACEAATGFPVMSPVQIAKFQRRLKDSGKAIDKTKAEIQSVKQGPGTRGQAKKLEELRLTLNAAYDHYQDASWHLRRASGHFEGTVEPEKWIQEIGLKRGEFTKLAAKQGMTAQEFIKDVLKHQKKYSPGLVKAARLRQTLTRVSRGEYSGPLAATRKLKKVCIGWKQHYSKFYKAKIWKCNEYARPAGDESCLVEPMDAPFSKRSIRSLARWYADQYNEQYGWRVPEFIKEIKERGGIRPYKARTREGKVDEEYMTNVPLFLRRKKGLPPDEMASEMGFDTDSDLYDAISEVYGAGKRKAAPTRKKKWDEFSEEAHNFLLEQTLGPR